MKHDGKCWEDLLRRSKRDNDGMLIVDNAGEAQFAPDGPMKRNWWS